MPLLLPAPQLQFLDANGRPYAGGSLATYAPGTTTPKNTWKDNQGTILNTNPIILDAAGRCLCLGDGDYRMILKDAAGNLIYDQYTSSVVSSAMQPVVGAATIADAVALLGISGLVQTETNRAQAAEANLQSQINTTNTNLANAETNLSNSITAEQNARIAADNNLQTQINNLGAAKIQHGFAVTDASGVTSVTFSPAFSSTPAVVATVQNNAFGDEWVQVNPSPTGFTAYVSQPAVGLGSLVGATVGFSWIAVGN